MNYFYYETIDGRTHDMDNECTETMFETFPGFVAFLNQYNGIIEIVRQDYINRIVKVEEEMEDDD